ncbi:MAG: ATP-dependent DNA helicase RecQ [Spirochaetales bacterium]|nr:ATP-dependent DNA helicase RecQ [Spirochaetales bacterium]
MENGVEYTDPVNASARDLFGIDYLMPFQRLVISNILESAWLNGHMGTTAKGMEYSTYLRQINPVDDPADRDCTPHQLVILPTGAGKSLCFLLPSFFLGGITLVIFPLLGLINDQLRRCCEAGISAVKVTGNMTRAERVQVCNQIGQNRAKIVLTNPEKLSDKSFRQLLKNRVSHLVIDEAHTVSQWGDSFRPSFLDLSGIIPELGAPIITAFTATASDHIRRRIQAVLFKNETLHIISQLTDRENIHYSVHRPLNKLQETLSLVSDPGRLPAIVFCSSRTGCEILARQLRLYSGRRDIFFYHAGLSADEKLKIEKWFFASDSGILCATCAYGMGVDKQNIRCVIHYDLPSGMEAYLQESGRAGRDRREASAIALVSSLKKYNGKSPLLSVFSINTVCRRKSYLAFLQQEPGHCAGCDVCDGQLYSPCLADTRFYDFARRSSGRYTPSEAAAILHGRLPYGFGKPFSGRYFGVMSNWDEHEIKNLLFDSCVEDTFFVPESGPWKNHLVYTSPIHTSLYSAAVFTKRLLRFFRHCFIKIFTFPVSLIQWINERKTCRTREIH